MSTVHFMQVGQDFIPSGEAFMETPELIEAAQDVLTQGLSLLFQLSDRSYANVVASPFNASIGQHYRHVLEHFQCLIKGVRSREINYDARERNPRLETEVTYASIATCDILSALKRYTEKTLAQECGVFSSVGYNSASPSFLPSNVARELAYCVGHAIHHYAIIRLIGSEMGIAIPAEFGFAPSTLKHMATLAAD